jgi:3'(2'), 5'-bisphosphate nucleotidase
MTQSLIALGSRRSKWQGAWRDRLLQSDFQFETESVGSALKFMRLAEGAADLYPRLGPTSEWDTAAPQAILDVTGGAVRQWNGKPLEYGKENVLNPHFIAVRDLSLLDVLISDS